jgi:hypothetical protein
MRRPCWTLTEVVIIVATAAGSVCDAGRIAPSQEILHQFSQDACAGVRTSRNCLAGSR